jgi:hypothetical protein
MTADKQQMALFLLLKRMLKLCETLGFNLQHDL